MDIDTAQTGSMMEKIEETLKLTKENNKLLKAMRRDAIIGGVVKILVWIILIGASFYFSMKFLEPYLGMLSAGKGGMPQDFGALYEQYKGLIGQ